MVRRNKFKTSWLVMLSCALLLWIAPLTGQAENSLSWKADKNLVDAHIDSWTLSELLPRLAAVTGWQVYVEPGLEQPISAKFSGLKTTDALERLLGKLNYAVVPQKNAASRLYIFKTERGNATQLVEVKEKKSKRIPNELVVTLKPGAKIEEIARQLGAKIVGRIDALGIYRLSFDNEEAANNAKAQLANLKDVAAVDYNYIASPPATAPQTITPSASAALPFSLNPAVNANGKNVIVGLIDTPLQSVDPAYNQFLLKSLSAAGDANVPTDSPTHGTSMLETLLQALSQVTPSGQSSVKVLPVDVYGNNTYTSTYDVAYGIYLAVQNGATVINLSLGSDGDVSYLHQIIQNTHNQGVTFFAAAGNDPVTTLTYPAAYPEVIGVTAVNSNGSYASYANRGDFAAVGLPGNSIVSFNGQYYLVSGTSTSTANASGLAAGIIQATGSASSAVKIIEQKFPSPSAKAQ